MNYVKLIDSVLARMWQLIVNGQPHSKGVSNKKQRDREFHRKKIQTENNENVNKLANVGKAVTSLMW